MVSWVSALFFWFKINSTPGVFFPFLCAIVHNFTSHKTLFQAHLLPKLTSPPWILKVEYGRRKNKGSKTQCGHSGDKL